MHKGVILLILLAVFFLFPNVALADIAPPEEPPGANISPNSLPTQVRMEAETVILDVLGDASGQAAVTASFTMRNLGTTSETLLVRFPLTFYDGESDGWGNYPEITDLRAKVNGRVVSTTRIMSASPPAPVPSAAFEATFAPDQAVAIEVKYTATATQEYEGGPPYLAFAYVLETGAGWYDTIGSADIIVRLPYEAEPLNVLLDESITGFSSTTPGAVLSGTEVRWHYENLEPTREHNMEITLVDPALWLQVLNERANISRQPEDGEAWGRLAKLYKEARSSRKGMRLDPAAEELFQLSAAAYEQAVTLLPEDALWHAGYGELLVRYHAEKSYSRQSENWSVLLPGFEELHRAYALAPEDPQVLDVLDRVDEYVPGLVHNEDGTFVFAFLTATPTSRPTVTRTPGPTVAVQSTTVPAPATPTPTEPAPTRSGAGMDAPEKGEQEESADSTDAPFLPVCGLGLLLLPMALVLNRRWGRRIA